MPDLRALRVAQTTSQLLQAKHLKQQPVWLPTVSRVPPSTDIARKPAPASLAHATAKKTHTKKVKRIFEPQRIRYNEDSLRERFYKEHPWELARPVLLLENDALDSTRMDWSRLEQPGRRTSGESVIQRQQYLINKESLSRDEAYLKACNELYKVRQREAIEARISWEEAIAYGTQFNASELEVGLKLEKQVLADWREKALYAKGLQQPGVGSYGPTNTKRRTGKEESEANSIVEEMGDDLLDDLLGLAGDETTSARKSPTT